jgi:hypothetical protein
MLISIMNTQILHNFSFLIENIFSKAYSIDNQYENLVKTC